MGDHTTKYFDFTGVWRSSYFLVNIIVHVRQQEQKVFGHAEIISLFGSKNIYHFTGEVERENVCASHHSGHSFTGKATAPNKAQGVLSLRNGGTLGLRAKRISFQPKLI